MSEHLLFLAFPLLFPPLKGKLLNFLYSCERKFSFVNNKMEAYLDDLSFKNLERVGKETNQIID